MDTTQPPAEPLLLVGVGADGWAGLGPAARDGLLAADVVVGGPRHLALLPLQVRAERRPWPSPLLPGLDALLADLRGRRLVVLASGDPLHFGIGRALTDRLGADRVRSLPAPSSISLACARLGWPVEDVDVVSLVGRPVSAVRRALHDGRRLLVLSADEHTPALVAAALGEAGCGGSAVTVLGELGGPSESCWSGTADTLSAVTDRPVDPGAAAGGTTACGTADVRSAVAQGHTDRGVAACGTADTLSAEVQAAGAPASTAAGAQTPTAAGQAPPWPRLNIVAVQVRADRPQPALTPGLPDDAYAHDGQLTKRHVRAVTLALLGPRPGRLLWDVGGGAGSIGIEWCRAHPSCRAVSVESHPDRADGIRGNADRLGVAAQLTVVAGRAPQALAGLQTPDAVFIGGGLTRAGVLDDCLAALRPGGTLVANAVTLESEAVLVQARARFGGELVRLEVSREGTVGGFTAWTPARPVTTWSLTKPDETDQTR